MVQTATKRKITDEQIAVLCHSISKKFVALGNLLDKFEFPGTSDETPKEEPVKRRRKTIRAVKDPLAPHRNLTSYIHFTNEVRPSIMKESPNIAPRDVARLLGLKWRALSDIERSKYNKIAKEDFTRYRHELAAYKQKTVELLKQDESATTSSEGESDEEDELASGNEEEAKTSTVKQKSPETATAPDDSGTGSSDSDDSESTESSSSDEE